MDKVLVVQAEGAEFGFPGHKPKPGGATMNVWNPWGGGVRPIPGVCWPASSVNLVTPDSLRDLVSQNKVGNNRAKHQKSISGFHQAHALAREREETEADVHTFSDAHVSSDCRTGIKTRVCCQSPPVSLQGYPTWLLPHCEGIRSHAFLGAFKW